jgi:hypothetical protein
MLLDHEHYLIYLDDLEQIKSAMLNILGGFGFGRSYTRASS